MDGLKLIRGDKILDAFYLATPFETKLTVAKSDGTITVFYFGMNAEGSTANPSAPRIDFNL
jgi:hypothetical protein